MHHIIVYLSFLFYPPHVSASNYAMINAAISKWHSYLPKHDKINKKDKQINNNIVHKLDLFCYIDHMHGDEYHRSNFILFTPRPVITH
jgi:hypothetical protein